MSKEETGVKSEVNTDVNSEFKTDVNIKVFPEQQESQTSDLVLTNLRGKVLPLIHGLQRYGYINLTQEEYQVFVDFHEPGSQTSQPQPSLEDVLNKLATPQKEPQDKPKDEEVSICLIGNLILSNDTDNSQEAHLLLLVLKALADAKPKGHDKLRLNIILAKEELELLKIHEAGISPGLPLSNAIRNLIIYSHSKNTDLPTLIEDGFINYLKLLWFSSTPSEKAQPIHTSASVSMEDIQRLGERMAPSSFKDKTARGVSSDMVKAINSRFRRYIKAKRFFFFCYLPECPDMGSKGPLYAFLEGTDPIKEQQKASPSPEVAPNPDSLSIPELLAVALILPTLGFSAALYNASTQKSRYAQGMEILTGLLTFNLLPALERIVITLSKIRRDPKQLHSLFSLKRNKPTEPSSLPPVHNEPKLFK